MKKVLIIKTGNAGNLKNIERVINRFGLDFDYFSPNSELSNYDRVILPGLGNFKDSMNYLQRDLEDIITIIKSKNFYNVRQH